MTENEVRQAVLELMRRVTRAAYEPPPIGRDVMLDNWIKEKLYE